MHVHFINLERSKDRLAEFLAVNSHLAEVTRLQAVDEERIDLRLLTEHGLVKEDILSRYPVSALCNALWHFEIWNMAIASGKHMTIADDGTIFNLKFDACATEVIETLPSDWDIIHWQWNFDEPIVFDMLPGVTPSVARCDKGAMRLNTGRFQELSLSPRAYRVTWLIGGSCYTVSPKGAQNLKSKVLPLRPYTFPWPEDFPKPSPTTVMQTCGIDLTLNSLYRELNAYVCFPPLVISKNKRSEALASQDRADDPEAHLIRGVTLHELNRLDEALASFDRAIALKPDYAEAFANRGHALKVLKRFDEALASYDRAVALHRSNSMEVFDALGLLTPFDIPHLIKKRLGRLMDGGYVLLDDFDEISAIYSIGIGDEVSFDEECANMGKKIFMFDHTVDCPPVKHANFHFFRHGAGRVNDDAASLYTIEHIIRRLGHDERSDLILKIDVEGVEYDIFSTMSRETLRHFRQITMEIHWLLNLGDPTFRAKFVAALSRINREFTLFHVHANNGRPIGLVDGFVVVDVLELSYVRSDLTQRESSKTVYPTSVDFPNVSQRPDYLLWFYPFIPVPDEVRSALKFDRALTVRRPHYAEALYNRGATLHQLKRFEEALASYDRALTVRPDYAEALYNRGNTLHQLKRFEDALASYDRALELRPDDAWVHFNRGNTLHELNRFEDALASYDRALELRPDDAWVHFNCGNSLHQLKRFEEALASYDRALELRPDDAWVHFIKACCRLLIGDFDRAWEKFNIERKRDFTQPLWLGSDEIAGKAILIYAQQGFGDTIQFCRYVPLVAERGARVILEVQAELHGLMSTLSGAAQIVSRGDPLPNFDLHCPLQSLPLAFSTRLETIPSAIPYLRASSQAVMNWNARLGPRGRPRIGLAWSGSPINSYDKNRSIMLSSLLPLLDIDATFVSLQQGVRTSDAAVLKVRSDLLDFGNELKNFSVAALISNLDLVISVDTSIAHLAGALEKPVWVMLPFIPNWRWLLDREDSPWYPTARLFRQDDSRTWDNVIARVHAALNDFVRSFRPTIGMRGVAAASGRT